MSENPFLSKDFRYDDSFEFKEIDPEAEKLFNRIIDAAGSNKRCMDQVAELRNRILNLGDATVREKTVRTGETVHGSQGLENARRREHRSVMDYLKLMEEDFRKAKRDVSWYKDIRSFRDDSRGHGRHPNSDDEQRDNVLRWALGIFPAFRPELAS